ncbi:MAG: ParA family protein [Chlamydiota bacterium]
MRKIAIVNQKGGSGKTTTAVNLAAALAESGKHILLVDLDPQASTSLSFGCKDRGKALFEVLTAERTVESAVQVTQVKNIDILSASPLLSNVEKILHQSHEGELFLRKKFATIPTDRWDYILFDCPPNLGMLVLNAFSLPELEVLVPVVTHVMALHGLLQLLKTVELVKKSLNSSLILSGILPCRVDQRTKHSREVLEQLKGRFADKMCRTVIRENVKLAEAPLHSISVLQHAPSCHGASDYRSLAKELISQEVVAVP